MARLTLGGALTRVLLRTPDGKTVAAVGRGPELTVTGEIGELALFIAGRDEARLAFSDPQPGRRSAPPAAACEASDQLVLGRQARRGGGDRAADGVGQRQRGLLGQLECDPGRGAQRRVEHIDVHRVAVGGVNGVVDVDGCSAWRRTSPSRPCRCRRRRSSRSDRCTWLSPSDGWRRSRRSGASRPAPLPPGRPGGRRRRTSAPRRRRNGTRASLSSRVSSASSVATASGDG